MSEPQLVSGLDRKIDAMRRELEATRVELARKLEAEQAMVKHLASLTEQRAAAERSRAELREWFWILMLFSVAGQVAVTEIVNALLGH